MHEILTAVNSNNFQYWSVKRGHGGGGGEGGGCSCVPHITSWLPLPATACTQVDVGAPRPVTLPRNTSWLVQPQLMGSSTPKSREQILALAKMGTHWYQHTRGCGSCRAWVESWPC